MRATNVLPHRDCRLGCDGDPMITNLDAYGGLVTALAWGPDPRACRHAAQQFNGLRISASATESIDDQTVQGVYIASPPASYRNYAEAADIRLHFCKWPRDWQIPVAWLSKRVEGGFVREAFSHCAHLTEKLFGPTERMHEFSRNPMPA